MIETIVNRSIAVLPRYGATLWKLLAHPVAEVAPRSRAGDHVWDAVLFWSVSMAFFLLTRYIAFSPGADSMLYFTARGLSSILQLLLVSMAFFLVWKLFGSRFRAGSFIIATACIHGIILPLEAVLSLVSFGVARIIDFDLYRVMVNSVNGCGQIVSPDTLGNASRTGLDGPDGPKLNLIGLYILLTLPLIGVLIAYGIAYFRVLAQLAEGRKPFGRARVLLMLVLGCLTAGLALSYTVVFDWTLFNDAAMCLPPQEG